MAVNCNVCWAWQPKEWGGWKWEDVVARCQVKGKFVTSNGACKRME